MRAKRGIPGKIRVTAHEARELKRQFPKNHFTDRAEVKML
jgi:hypothetical protein